MYGKMCARSKALSVNINVCLVVCMCFCLAVSRILLHLNDEVKDSRKQTVYAQNTAIS